MQNKDSIIFKIQKLVEKAQSSDSIHESETFMLKAQELLQSYNLEMSNIFRESNESKSVTNDSIGFSEQWESSLMACISRNNFCKCLISACRTKLYIFGRPENVNAVEYLYQFFRNKILSLSVLSYKSYLEKKQAEIKSMGVKENIKPPKKFQKDYISDYLDGCVYGVGQKLTEQKKQAESENSHLRGLVLSSEADIEKYIYDKFGSYSKSRAKGRTVTNMDGYNNGISDGRSISVNHGITQQ